MISALAIAYNEEHNIEKFIKSLYFADEIIIVDSESSDATAEIAKKLFISPRTVEVHRKNLLDKTGVKNVAGLVVFAIKNDLVPPIIIE